MTSQIPMRAGAKQKSEPWGLGSGLSGLGSYIPSRGWIMANYGELRVRSVRVLWARADEVR